MFLEFQLNSAFCFDKFWRNCQKLIFCDFFFSSLFVFYVNLGILEINKLQICNILIIFNIKLSSKLKYEKLSNLTSLYIIKLVQRQNYVLIIYIDVCKITVERSAKHLCFLTMANQTSFLLYKISLDISIWAFLTSISIQNL